MSKESNNRVTIAFVCENNAIHGQMAKGFLKELSDDNYMVYSVGTTDENGIEPNTIAVMNEANIDVSTQKTNSLLELPKKIDILITMGSSPTMTGDIEYDHREHWDVTNPEDNNLDSFRSLRDTIEEKCSKLVKRIEHGQIVTSYAKPSEINDVAKHEDHLKINKMEGAQTEQTTEYENAISNDNGPIQMNEAEYDNLINTIDNKANYPLSIILGFIFGIVGAAIWALISKATGYNLGIIAILIGFLISQGFVMGGRSTKMGMGVIAAIIALISVLIGNIILAFLFIAEYAHISFVELVTSFDYGNYLFELLKDIHSPLDIVFYPIAMITAFKRSYINKNSLNVVIVPDSMKQ